MLDAAAIKARVRIEDVVRGALGEMKREGKNLVACCPFHSEKSASFKVDIEGQMFKCFGCGAGGDVIAFVMKYDKCDYNAAVQKLGGATPAPRQPPKPAQVFSTLELLDKSVAYHAANKGGKVVARFDYPDGLYVYRVELAPKDGKKRGKIFPQCHAVEGGFVYGGVEKSQPYHVEELKDAKQVIICEGELKVERLKTLGYTATCSAGGSQAAGKTDWRALAGKTLIIWRDNDAPGEKYQTEVIELLKELNPRPRISILPVDEIGLPQGGDVVDLLAKYTVPDEARGVVKCALELACPIGALAELHQELAEAVSGERFNLPTPWPIFDSLANALIPAGVVLIGGDPGSTKSLALLQMLRHWTAAHIPAACLLLENSIPHAMRRALAQISGESNVTIDAWCKANPEKLAAIQAAAETDLHALANVLDVLPADTEPTVDKLLAWLEKRLNSSARLCAIDPITALQTGPQPWQDHSKFVWGAKRMIEKAKASLLLITHPAGQRTGGRNLEMADIAGGKCFVRFSQTVILLTAEKNKSVTVESGMGTSEELCNRKFYIWKANNGRAPKNCRIALYFDWHSLTLKELGRELE